MEPKKQLPNLKQSSNQKVMDSNLSLGSSHRAHQIQAIIAESERLLKLDWVQKKLEKRLAETFKGSSEHFTL